VLRGICYDINDANSWNKVLSVNETRDRGSPNCGRKRTPWKSYRTGIGDWG